MYIDLFKRVTSLDARYLGAWKPTLVVDINSVHNTSSLATSDFHSKY